ncbi:restriction endonuclease subunit S [Meiothermus sp.]|uniref:restriction endonuclease subunit S n=1 Tax=Meiothermus sp. TaxID=1955249 RepID=UPI00307E612B
METELGVIAPGDWCIRSLEDVCARITSGGTPSRRDPTYYIDGTWPWVKTQELQDKWIDRTEESISERAVAESSAKVLPANTILVAMYGATVGQLGLLRRPMTCNQACCALVVDETLANYRFVFYQLLHARSQLKHLATGAAQQNLSGVLIRSLRFPYPSVSEQRAIAHILGTLDDKIELNRRMSETLEAMARALFKSWFVDFDPVRATMKGRDPGLPQPLADLFPDRLVDSELGEIPEGWEVKALPEVIEVNPARSLRKGEVAPYLDMANMPTRGHSPDAVIDRPFGSGMRFVNGDTLVARITPCLENGKTAFVDFLKDGQVGWGSTEYIVLHPKARLPAEFAYCLARSDGFRDFAIQSMTGSTGRQRVAAESLDHFLLPVPSEPIARAFGLAVGPMFARAREAAAESRTLAALRDALLPKLISGELRVKDAERFLKERGL